MRWKNGESNVELYEALKGSLPEDAARMIAEVVPPARELATSADIARLEGKIDRAAASNMRWMLALFLPVWAGTWATFVAILLKI